MAKQGGFETDMYGIFGRLTAEMIWCNVLYPAERRHVDGLSAHDAGAADTGGVFTRARVDHSLDDNLNKVR